MSEPWNCIHTTSEGKRESDLQWWIQDFPEVGVPTYDFVKFSQKLHEIERIWTSKILLCRSATDLIWESFVPILKWNSRLTDLKSYYQNTCNPSNRYHFRLLYFEYELTLTLEVSAAVGVTVLEAPHVHLVERWLLPPRLRRGRLKHNISNFNGCTGFMSDITTDFRFF